MTLERILEAAINRPGKFEGETEAIEALWSETETAEEEHGGDPDETDETNEESN